MLHANYAVNGQGLLLVPSSIANEPIFPVLDPVSAAPSTLGTISSSLLEQTRVFEPYLPAGHILETSQQNPITTCSNNQSALSSKQGAYIDPDPRSYESMGEEELEALERELLARLQRKAAKRKLNYSSESVAIPSQQPVPCVPPPVANDTATKINIDEQSTEPMLCPEQAALVDLIMSGRNVFYTGSAGCGKSTVLRAFVAQLRAMGKEVRIIAPTGKAALAVNGTTTWTFAGWTPDSNKLPLDEIRKKAHGTKVYERIKKKCDVLVIDEISMIEATHFERLNVLMKEVRNAQTGAQPAFGGCQIVVTGDFCQLPPVRAFQHCYECGHELTRKTVNDGRLVHSCKRCRIDYADEDQWAFRSQAWRECGFEHVHLKTIHRQNDQVFIKMLQKCRLGDQLTDQEVSLLMRHTPCIVHNATKLFCRNEDADRVNRMEFQKIEAPAFSYWALDRFDQRDHHPDLWSKGQPVPWGSDFWCAEPPRTKHPLKGLNDHSFRKGVELKKGMLVVLLCNLDLDKGLCNGSLGVIQKFVNYDPKKMPKQQKYKTDRDGNSKPIELREGQRPLRGEHALLMEMEIQRFIDSECAPVKKWPVVHFHNGEVRTIQADCRVNSLGDEKPYSLLCRTQIPLAPAWAMTVHKSQSLTLDRVIVNLDRVFEEGQVYVALSRATGLKGLRIDGDGGFLRNKLTVNTEVAAFLKEKFGDIYGAEEPEPESVDGLI